MKTYRFLLVILMTVFLGVVLISGCQSPLDDLEEELTDDREYLAFSSGESYEADIYIMNVSTHYLANYFEDDINRDFNYSCYQQAEEGDFEKDKIMKTKREKWDMFMYSNLLYRELSFKMKFKNNCYVNLSTPG